MAFYTLILVSLQLASALAPQGARAQGGPELPAASSAAAPGAAPAPAPAAPTPSGAARAAQRAREAYREQINENVLFLMGGQLGAAYIQLAHDISVVVNDGNNLRVLPVVGAAGVQNVHDVVFLRGIDLALTNVLTLNTLRKDKTLGPSLERQIAYIAPLFPEEMQIVARKGVASLEALRGKKVSFNNKGSATASFAPQVFKALGIDVVEEFMGQPDALEKIRSGEIEATVCMCPKPVPAFTGIRPDAGLIMLEVPYTRALEADYLPASISHADYPGLVAKDGNVDTIAGSTVLITFNWPQGSVRYNRTAKFVDAFFSKFDKLLVAPRHPLWRSVNLAANVPGWTRFSAAQEWLDRHRTQRTATIEAAFAEFIKRKAAAQPGLDTQDAEERERLFREFLKEWQASRR